MNKKYDTKHIKVLDGIRALAILVVMWFHFYQQNWLIPAIGNISFDRIPRYGFLLVDMMILLSAFCLFIPYARSKIYKEPTPNTKDFYIKRIARIVPSYYLVLIVCFIFIMIEGNFDKNFLIKDTLMHIFFINNYSLDTLTGSLYTRVLWTIAIEVQFYLIFPFIAKLFIKKPKETYIGMLVIGLISTFIIRLIVNDDNIGYYVNHILTFIPVLANGMLASYFYVKYTKKKKRDSFNDLVFTVISISMIAIYVYFINTMHDQTIQYWQIDNRFILSIVFSIFIISTALASKTYQKIYNNGVMRYIAIISMNLYIYHQFIAVKLKEYRIPTYNGNLPPNVRGDVNWQWSYTVICLAASLLVATAVTYYFEKPIAKLIKKKYIKE